MEEAAPDRQAMHKCLRSLITILGLCLQLKFPDASPFVVDYSSNALIRAFVVDILAYFGSLVVMFLQDNHYDRDLGEFMNKISLLFGTLAVTLELLILVPPCGWLMLVFWSIHVVRVATQSYPLLITLYASTVAALGRAYDKLNELIRTRGLAPEPEPDQHQINELPRALENV